MVDLISFELTKSGILWYIIWPIIIITYRYTSHARDTIVTIGKNIIFDEFSSRKMVFIFSLLRTTRHTNKSDAYILSAGLRRHGATLAAAILVVDRALGRWSYSGYIGIVTMVIKAYNIKETRTTLRYTAYTGTRVSVISRLSCAWRVEVKVICCCKHYSYTTFLISIPVNWFLLTVIEVLLILSVLLGR